MRVADKKELTGKALFNYLRENKDQLINTKKSMPIYAEPFAVDMEAEAFKTEFTVKELEGKDSDPNSIIVKVVANTSMYCDSHMDVLAPDCWKKTIKENGVNGKNIISHIYDHNHSIEAKIGKVLDIRSEEISLSKLGVKGASGSTQVLIFETEVRKDFNAKIFNLYKAGEVNQHSIGLQYVKMDLAVNDDSEDFKQEYKVWKKNIDSVINKKQVEERGYFWYVSEIKLFENSAVLFGANEVTPTLEVSKSEPLEDTQDNDKKAEPSNGDTQGKQISIYNLI